MKTLLMLAMVGLVAFLLANDINDRGSSLASISSANQLLSQYNNPQTLRSLTQSEKDELIERIDLEIFDLETNVDFLQNTLQERQRDLQEVENQTNGHNNSAIINAQIISNQVIVTGLEAKKNNLQRRYERRSSRCSNLRGGSRRNCNQGARDLRRQVNQVQSSINAYNANINLLRASLSNISNNRNDFISQKNEIELEISYLNSSIEEAEGKIDQLKNLRQDVSDTGTGGGENYGGCTNPDAENFDPEANGVDDGSCIILAKGCRDTFASNFDSTADVDDGSCEYDFESCAQDGTCLDDSEEGYGGAGDVCAADPSAEGCEDYCIDNPDAEGCVDICEEDITGPGCKCEGADFAVYTRLTEYCYPGDKTCGGTKDTNSNNLVQPTDFTAGSAAADTSIFPSGAILDYGSGFAVNHDWGPAVNARKATLGDWAAIVIQNYYKFGNGKDENKRGEDISSAEARSTPEYGSPVIDIYKPTADIKENARWIDVCVYNPPELLPIKEGGQPKLSADDVERRFIEANLLMSSKASE